MQMSKSGLYLIFLLIIIIILLAIFFNDTSNFRACAMSKGHVEHNMVEILEFSIIHLKKYS